MNLYSVIDEYIGKIQLQKRDSYIQAIINKSYRGYLGSSTFCSYNKKVLPNKPKGAHPLNYILYEIGYKYCGHCKDIKPISEFRKNSYNKDNLQTYCIVCHAETTAKTQAKRQAKRRLIQETQQPQWASETELLNFYNDCPPGMQVDHIIPLNNSLVCGLHCIDNLQYLSARDNSIKHNKFTI